MVRPKISVIIPIYNVEKYLDSCIRSVRRQTFKDIEILCVDDCSPDDSYLIVEKHAAEDSRVSLIRHEKNLGLGGARNTAIRVAQADYIASVDSDDSMLPNMLEVLWEATDNGWFDVVCCGFNRVNSCGNILSSQVYPAKDLLNENNDIDIFSVLNPAFWNKLWRKSLFVENDIFFPEKDYFEDMPTTPRLLSNAKYIKIIEDRLYNYFIRSGSITTTYGPKHLIDYFKGFEIILMYLDGKKLTTRYENEFLDYVNSGLRFHSDNVVGSNMNKDELEQYFRFLLIIKIAFFENWDVLRLKNLGELLELLKQKKMPSVWEQKKPILDQLNKENIQILEDISKYQKLLISKEEEVNSEISKYSKEIENSKKLLEELCLENKKLKNNLSEYKKRQDAVLNEKLSCQMEALQYKEQLQLIEKERKEVLSGGQKVGVFLFGIILRPFFTYKEYAKLKQRPRLFFKDSKNTFTRVIGTMLDIL